jgi:hypothetical protein
MQKHDPYDLQVFVHGIGPDTWQWTRKARPSGKIPPIRSGIVGGTYRYAMKAGEQKRLKLIYRGELV